MASCVLGDAKTARLLLRCGASVEQEDSQGRSALCYAACRCNAKTVRALVEEEGASVDIR